MNIVYSGNFKIYQMSSCHLDLYLEGLLRLQTYIKEKFVRKLWHYYKIWLANVVVLKTK